MRRRAARAVVGAAILGLLAGCAPSVGGGWTSSGAKAGYVSSDLSVTEWKAADRTGPVDITGTDFTGAAVDVSAWRGDVVVLNTWYAACPPCRAEAPDLAAVAQEYATKGVHVLGINGEDDAGAAQAFERTFAIPYPSVQDSGSSAVAALQGLVSMDAVPTTVVLDRTGKVAARILGRLDGSTLRALLDDALAEAA
ncbi:MAG TPA: TlpA disulfide reductase family protein [Actinotalea sp.]